MKPFLSISDKDDSSSFVISGDSSSESFEKRLYNFINDSSVTMNVEETNPGTWKRMRKMPAWGVVLGILSMVFELTMLVNAKILFNDDAATPFEIIYMWGVSDLIITIILCQVYNIPVVNIEPEQRGHVKLQMIFAAASAVFSFLALKSNSLSLSASLIFTSPAFTCIFALIVFNEGISNYNILNFLWWLVGATLISNPFNHFKNYESIVSVPMGVLAGITIAAWYTSVKVIFK